MFKVTSKYLNNEYDARAQEYKLSYKKWDQIEADIKVYEENLVQAGSACTFFSKQEIASSVGKVNSNLNTLSKEQVGSDSVYQATSCLVESLTYLSPYAQGSLTSNERIREHIRKLKRIGAESSFGAALQGDFDSNDKLFIVKAPLTSDTDLLHEIIVGLYGTNFLRRDIPNFAYIYGGFKCGAPIIDDKTKEVLTWCLDNNNKVNYVLYENIRDAVSLASYIKTCSGIEFLDAYIQMMFALRHAFNVIDFTHYDLHAENVMIRNLFTNNGDSISNKNMFSIEYPTSDGPRYVNTSIISTVIDEGMAHVQTRVPKDYQSMSVGVGGFYAYSIYPDRPYIWHDVYKLLMFSLLNAKDNKNQQVIDVCSTLFRFFNDTDDPLVAIDTEWDIRYAFAYNDTWESRSIDDFINYIYENFDLGDLVTEEPMYSVLQCSKLCESGACATGNCTSEKQVYNSIGLFNTAPSSIIEYYESKLSSITVNTESFDYKTAMFDHLRKIYALLNELEVVLKRVNLIDLNGFDFFTPESQEITRQLYLESAIIYDDLTRIKMLLKVASDVASEFGDTDGQLKLEEISNELDNLSSAINQVKSNLTDVNNTLNSLQAVKGYGWYKTTRKNYAFALGL